MLANLSLAFQRKDHVIKGANAEGEGKNGDGCEEGTFGQDAKAVTQAVPEGSHFCRSRKFKARSCSQQIRQVRSHFMLLVSRAPLVWA
jgi:hypothetical protein